MRLTVRRFMTLVSGLGLAACADSPGTTASKTPIHPDFSKTTWVASVDNEYFPLPAGAKWSYQSRTDLGTLRADVEVLATTRTIQGVAATIVREIVYLDSEVVEDTQDWYAQDSDGNVWYLGEDTCDFVDGACADTSGSWEWGVDGSIPGFIMPAHPHADGVVYYQEWHPGGAEDAGEVVATNVNVSLQIGSFNGCITTHDTSTLADESDLDARTTYCRGIGKVAVEHGEEGDAKLMSFVGLRPIND